MKNKVTRNALLKRINRKLAHEGLAIKTCRTNSRWYNDLGPYYQVELGTNNLTGQNMNLEEVGDELGCLKKSETLEA